MGYTVTVVTINNVTTVTHRKERGNMSIGENIKRRRTENGMTQEEFSSQIGVGRSMLAQIERGTKIPNMILGSSIAQVLGCTMDELVKGKEA